MFLDGKPQENCDLMSHDVGVSTNASNKRIWCWDNYW